jgi:hypothetical protein
VHLKGTPTWFQTYAKLTTKITPNSQNRKRQKKLHQITEKFWPFSRNIHGNSPSNHKANVVKYRSCVGGFFANRLSQFVKDDKAVVFAMVTHLQSIKLGSTQNKQPNNFMA